jgi:hypothetical protein
VCEDEFSDLSVSEMESDQERWTETKKKPKGNKSKKKEKDKTELWTRIFDGKSDLKDDIKTYLVHQE